MEFCTVCDNMLYLQVEEDKKLKVYCKNCNFFKIKDPDQVGSVPVAQKKFSSDANSYKNFMTPYIKYDRTLPRVNNIKCPRQDCKPETNEVMYIKYDHDNMKYLYYCCHCEHFWKN